MDIVSSPMVGSSIPKNIMLVVRSIYLNLPKMGEIFYHGMLMPLHDSMPSFMNFRRVLDLPEFKTRHLNVLPAINGAMVFEVHCHFLHGT